jgi:hypothetical protein
MSDEYGYGTTSGSTAATEITAGTEPNNSAISYTWTSTQKKVLVQNSKDAVLYVLWGTGTASATNYDVCLGNQYDSVASPDGVFISAVSCYSTATYAAGEIMVRGWS